jgi:hypothetical protein
VRVVRDSERSRAEERSSGFTALEVRERIRRYDVKSGRVEERVWRTSLLGVS